MLEIRRMFAVLVAALAIFSSVPVEASVVEAMDLEQLVADADEILVGRVIFKESFYRDGQRIVTQTRIAVDDKLKGAVRVSDEVIVETMGGIVGEVGMRVEGEASLGMNQRVMVFVRRGERLVYRSVGMAQGAMMIRKVEGREMVVPNRRGMLLVRRDAAGRLVKGTPALDKARPLGEFMNDVRRVVADQKRAR